VQFWAGHTFGGNPVSCAVGEAAVRYLLDHDLIGNAERVGNYLAARLEDLAARQPAIAEVRGIGMLRGVAFKEPIGQGVYDAARRRGLLTRPGADWVGVAPPLCTTRDEADEIAGILEAAVAEVVA
jgi:adenosylmethionine-8-amino-7-oxononanoate aminotransferase